MAQAAVARPYPSDPDVMGRSLLRAGKNVVSLVGAHFANRLLHLFVIGLLGHRLGTNGLGGFAIASAVSALFIFGTDLGLSAWLVREATARPTVLPKKYAEVFGVKLALIVVALLLLAVLCWLLPYQRWVLQLAALMAIAAMIESVCAVNNAVVQAHERMEYEALGATVQAVLFAGLAAVVLVRDMSPVWIGVAAIAGAVGEFAVSMHAASRFLPVGVAWPPRWTRLGTSAPYAVTSLHAVVLVQLDVLVFSAVATQSSVGEYGAVARLLHGLAFLPALAATAALPTVTSAWTRRSGAEVEALAVHVLRLCMVTGGAAVVLVWATAGPIMRTVYGDQFGALSSLLQLGMMFVLLRCFGFGLATLLTAAGRQRARAWAWGIGLTVTAALIIPLAPELGTRGALLALIVGEIVACGMLGMSSHTLVSARSQVTVLGGVMIALAGAAVVQELVNREGLARYALLWAPLTYPLLLLLVGEFGRVRRAVRVLAGQTPIRP